MKWTTGHPVNSVKVAMRVKQKLTKGEWSRLPCSRKNQNKGLD